MSAASSKIYEIRLSITGSDVNSTDELVLLLSGSGDALFQVTTVTNSVVDWQAGQQFSGSTLIDEYNTALPSSGEEVFAARLQNQDGSCAGQLSGIVLFES